MFFTWCQILRTQQRGQKYLSPTEYTIKAYQTLGTWATAHHFSLPKFLKNIVYIFNSTSPFPLAPYNLSLIHTVLFQQYPQKLNNDFLTNPMAYFEAFTLCDFLATYHCWKFLPDVLSTLIFSLSTLAFSKVFSSSQWSKKMKFKRIFLGN